MNHPKPDPRPFKRAGTPKTHRVKDAYEEGAGVTSTVMCHLHEVTGVGRSERPKHLVHLTPEAQVDVFEAALRVVRDGFAADLAGTLLDEVVPHFVWKTETTSTGDGMHARVRRGVELLGRLAVEVVVAEAGAARTPSKTVRLLDVVPCPEEVREHPLRSLIGLFMRVLELARVRELQADLGEGVYGHLLAVYACSVQESSEDECRAALQAFADATPSPDAFFGLLCEGQVQLAQVIAAHVADPGRRLDPTLRCAPCGISYDPPDVPREELERSARRLRRGEGELDAASARADEPEREEDRRLEVAWIDREISQLDRPGWPRTPAKQSALERLRGRRAELCAPPPDPPDAPRPVADGRVREVRYLSEDDRRWLQLAARPRGVLNPPECPDALRLERDGLLIFDVVDGRTRSRTTPAGLRAIETWRHEVRAG